MKTITKILLFTLIALLVLAGCTKGPSPNLCPTVCDGLVAYYPFYGDATDKSGNGHDGKVIGATLTKDRNGYQNHAYEFDGKRDLIELPDLTTKHTSQLSIVVVFKLLSLPTVGKYPEYAILRSTKSREGLGFQIVNKEAHLRMEVDKKIGTNWRKRVLDVRSRGHKIGKYIHVVGVINEQKELSIFADGRLITNKSVHWENYKPPMKFLVGSSRGGKEQLHGTIDEVRIYNRALSADEVKELYLFTSAFPPAE